MNNVSVESTANGRGEVSTVAMEDQYGPWMVMDRKQRRSNRLTVVKQGGNLVVGNRSGSRFDLLGEN